MTKTDELVLKSSRRSRNINLGVFLIVFTLNLQLVVLGFFVDPALPFLDRVFPISLLLVSIIVFAVDAWTAHALHRLGVAWPTPLLLHFAYAVADGVRGLGALLAATQVVIEWGLSRPKTLAGLQASGAIDVDRQRERAIEFLRHVAQMLPEVDRDNSVETAIDYLHFYGNSDQEVRRITKVFAGRFALTALDGRFSLAPSAGSRAGRAVAIVLAILASLSLAVGLVKNLPELLGGTWSPEGGALAGSFIAIVVLFGGWSAWRQSR